MLLLVTSEYLLDGYLNPDIHSGLLCRYGPDAQHSTHLASHTARNVVLVYVDMRGFARRALLKKAGKEFVKARVGGSKSTPVVPAPTAAKA